MWCAFRTSILYLSPFRANPKSLEIADFQGISNVCLPKISPKISLRFNFKRLKKNTAQSLAPKPQNQFQNLYAISLGHIGVELKSLDFEDRFGVGSA